MFCPAQTQPALHILTLAPSRPVTFFSYPPYPAQQRKKVILSITVFSGNCILPFSSELSNSCKIADSAQTEYCSTFHCPFVRPCVTGVTFHISHIYKGINAMLIIKSYIF